MDYTITALAIFGVAACTFLLVQGLQKMMIGKGIVQNGVEVKGQLLGLEQKKRFWMGTAFSLKVKYTLAGKTYTQSLPIELEEVPKYNQTPPMTVDLTADAQHPAHVCIAGQNPLHKAKQELQTTAVLAVVIVIALVVRRVWPRAQ